MSCSYGPGRYDPLYEEKGMDYPPGYVRWTENRNMQAFQELLAQGRIDVSFLTTHTFPLEKAPEAYDLMLSRSEPFIGILIQYDTDRHPAAGPRSVSLPGPAHHPGAAKVGIGFIGAGSYAQSHLLPNLPRSEDIRLLGVATTTSASAWSSAERFGFGFCTTDPQEILAHADINTVFVASRHDSHAPYVMDALGAGKHVFVEKPLCLKEEELEAITELLQNLREERGAAAPLLMVGYNRRFSPFLEELRRTIPQGPMAIVYRVNSGAIPGDSWIQDPDVGGGRIIGEVCHFVDSVTFLTRSLPLSVYAAVLPDPHHLRDSLQVMLTCADGSVGTIAYLANGDKSLPKERIEVFAHGVAAVVEDYRELFLHARGKRKKRTLMAQDKGQKNEVQAFVDAIRNGGAEPIPLEEVLSTSRVTFKILESLRTGECVKV
jgi:predicted dehydrogenase